MLRLHHLMESMRQGNINRVDILHPDLAYQYNTSLSEKGGGLKCFHIGSVEPLLDIEWELDKVFLPYQECWFEFSYTAGTGADKTIGVMCYTLEDTSISGIVYDVSSNITPGVLGSWMSFKNEEFNKIYALPNHQDFGDMMLSYRNLIFTFLTLLNSNNVKRIRTDPPAALQRARSKRGKLPLHSYWTLNLTLAKEEVIREVLSRQGIIGRNSPREHQRRAHERTLRSGRKVPVKQAKVGNKAIGTVDKDYSVKFI